MAITDLTNTIWVVPAGWSATAGYGRFNISASVGWDNYGVGNLLAIEHFDIGYRNGASTANFIDVYASSDIFRIPSTNSAELTIEGGTDATNPALISWLEANGECQNPPAPEEPTVTIEYNGSVIASLKAGQTATLPCKDKPMLTDVVVTVPEGMGAGEVVEEWDGSYTISGGTISFTVDGVSYEAEDGMTWEQWVASDYNTDGYINNGYSIITSDRNQVVRKENGWEGIALTDVIIADYTYKLSSGGAG